jgi:hypothetical protein
MTDPTRYIFAEMPNDKEIRRLRSHLAQIAAIDIDAFEKIVGTDYGALSLQLFKTLKEVVSIARHAFADEVTEVNLKGKSE